MDPQAYNSPTYTLIPTYTYINNNPYSATPHNNHLPFYLYLLPLPLACQHKQQKQTHQRYCSKTVITFLIIHYQVLRHQECVHSLECNQYRQPFHDSTSKKCALFSSVCHVGPIHTQAIGHHGNKSEHVLHIKFNNQTCIFIARVTEHLSICRRSMPLYLFDTVKELGKTEC